MSLQLYVQSHHVLCDTVVLGATLEGVNQQLTFKGAYCKTCDYVIAVVCAISPCTL